MNMTTQATTTMDQQSKQQQQKPSPRPTRPIRSLLHKMKRNKSANLEQSDDQWDAINSPIRRATFPGSVIPVQPMSELISQKQINTIVNDDLQWQKLKVSMKLHGRATTGMRLLAELPLLLQERLKELDTPPMTEDEDDDAAGEGEPVMKKETRRRRSRFLGRRSLQKERVNVAACQYRSESLSTDVVDRTNSDPPVEEDESENRQSKSVDNFTSSLGVQEQELLNLLDLAGAMAEATSNNSPSRRLMSPANVASAKTA